MLMMDSVFNLFTKCFSLSNIARLESVFCLIVDRRYVFSVRRHENDLSAEHDVAGMVAIVSWLFLLRKTKNLKLSSYFAISLAVLGWQSV